MGLEEQKLTTMPSRFTLSRLIKKRNHFEDEGFANADRKRKTEGKYPELEDALLRWVKVSQSQRELRKKRVEEYRKTNIQSYFTK